MLDFGLAKRTAGANLREQAVTTLATGAEPGARHGGLDPQLRFGKPCAWNSDSRWRRARVPGGRDLRRSDPQGFPQLVREDIRPVSGTRRSGSDERSLFPQRESCACSSRSGSGKELTALLHGLFPIPADVWHYAPSLARLADKSRLLFDEEAEHPTTREDQAVKNTTSSAFEAATAAFHQALRANDAEALFAYVAEDVLLMPPGEDTVRGRNAMRDWYAAFLSQYRTSSLTLSDREGSSATGGPSSSAPMNGPSRQQRAAMRSSIAAITCKSGSRSPPANGASSKRFGTVRRRRLRRNDGGHSGEPLIVRGSGLRVASAPGGALNGSTGMRS